MSAIEKVLSIASAELGTKESPPNSNLCKYSRWYPMPGQPWCAMFVSWVLEKAGVSGYRHAYTPAGADLFRSQGRWSDKPRKGAIAYMDFPDSTHRIQHVGIVESFSGSTVVCIEGNTSVDDDDNGGCVMRRERPAAWIVGYGLPPYVGEGGGRGGKVRDWLEVGDRGSDVRMLQRHLNVILDADLEEDGDFGEMTQRATKEFQREHGHEPTGKLGARQLKEIEKLFHEAKKERPDSPPVLTMWDEGEAVERAQKRLVQFGYAIHDAELKQRMFGTSMADAVQKFKVDNGWRERPILGKRAWTKLLEESKKVKAVDG